MKNKILFSLLSLAFASNLAAAPITPEQALARMESSGMRHAKAISSPELRSVEYGNDGVPSIYIYTYSGSDGFMLLSADDAVPALLGYSETNSFAIDDMSADMRWWLDLYSAQITDARGLEPYKARATRADSWAPIQPMLTTNWDQGSPYNNLCPRVGGYRCVTGCVATAMAQVMNYWKYPAVGTGSVSYTLAASEEDLFMDFSDTPFDWDKMKDRYRSGSYTAAESKAVATLMQACGYSVKMNYTPGSSGAHASDIRGALSNYFGYDKEMSRKERNTYMNQDEWNALIYKDLALGCPVIYSGQSSGGGHCFVCDGYDGKGYFHINWGWSGVSDGYFLLNELTPHEVGTGGHYGGYNISQEVTLGIMPPVGRLTLVGDIDVANKAADSGNVSGWGKTIRLNDFHNIALTMKVRVSGGVVYSPIYITVYETDPNTVQNVRTVYESQSAQPLHASEGVTEYSTVVDLANYDVSKLYTLYIAYELKGERKTIGTLRMAASSGVDGVADDDSELAIVREGSILRSSGEGEITLQIFDLGGSLIASSQGDAPTISLTSLTPGVYVGRAVSRSGESRTLKLLLK